LKISRLTKIKTLFLVHEAPRDQDLDLEDYITGTQTKHVRVKAPRLRMKMHKESLG